MTRWHFFLQMSAEYNLAYFWKHLKTLNKKIKQQ